MMSTDEKLVRFINLLHVRTEEGKIIWSQTPVFGVYKITLPSLHTVEVGSNDWDSHFIKIYNPCSTLMECSKNLNGIVDLHSVAKRQALKVSERLDQLLKYLEGMS